MNRMAAAVALLACAQAGCVYEIETDWVRGETLSRVEFGSVGGAHRLSFDLPDDARGFMLALEANRFGSARLERLEAPDGFAYIEDGGYLLNGQQVGAGSWTTVSLPYGDALMSVDVQPGTWTADVDGVAGGELWVRRGYDEGGVVNLVLHAPPGARDPEYLDGLFAATFPFAGLELGEVEIVEVDEAPHVLGGEDVRDLLATGAGSLAWPAIDVFFVDSAAIGGVLAGGVSAMSGIPDSGTPKSGLVVRYTDDGVPHGKTLAHELGHFMGLMHTTDAGEFHRADLILDTPVCPTKEREDDPTACPDYSNIMFGSGTTEVFSPTQRDILRRSVAYSAAP